LVRNRSKGKKTAAARKKAEGINLGGKGDSVVRGKVHFSEVAGQKSYWGGEKKNSGERTVVDAHARKT